MKIDWPQRGHGYTEEEIAAVCRVMRSTQRSLTQGPEVLDFEKNFANYVGVKKAFSLMSCANALDISALLMQIQPGDEVIIPAHTYCASAHAFARRGAIIRWADIDKYSWTASLDSISKLCSTKTKAIIVVHLYGLLCPQIEGIAKLSKDKKIFLLEDCAQALGAKMGNKHAGTFGDFGCYSFHAQKNLTTLGEGGMLIVANNEFAKKIPGLRLNGHSPFGERVDYWLPAMTNVDQDIEGVWPIKSTMNEAQAAVGSLLLRRLDDLTELRRKRSTQVRDELVDFPELVFQNIPAQEMHSHHLLPARCVSTTWNRNDLIRLLHDEYQIKSIIQYHPLNRYDLFKKMGFDLADIPVTDDFFDNMISFPFSVEMPPEDFKYLINSIKQAILKLRR